jgi:hypothetical protein
MIRVKAQRIDSTAKGEKIQRFLLDPENTWRFGEEPMDVKSHLESPRLTDEALQWFQDSE